MSQFSRREIITGLVSGVGLTLLCPVIPGCRTTGTKPPMLPPGPLIGSETHSMVEFFGIGKETANKVLTRALRHGGDFADLFLEHRNSEGLKLEEGKVNGVGADIKMGAGVRVFLGDQSGYAYTESITEEDLLQAAETASLIAHSAAQEAKADFLGVKVPSLYPVQRIPTEVPIPEKMDLLRRIDKAARAASNAIRVVVVAHNNDYRRVLIYRSDGLVVSDCRPYTSLSCMVSVQKGTRTERNWYEEGGMRDQSFYAGDRPEKIAREAVKRAMISLEAVVPPAGEMPVVLAPGHSGMLLHEAIGHGLEADFNRKKISIYADRIGEKVASEFCTIVDDGTVQHSRGALNVDDEGTPGQRTVLIERGVLRGYMCDLISARQLKTAPTGNGRRESYRYQPIPRMTTTYLVNGPHSKEEMFAGVERGIYAIDFTNGQVNIGAGDYTFFVNYGYLIEKGKITRPIKDVNIIGNGPKSLQQVDRVGNDLLIPDMGQGYCGKDGQRVPVCFGLPHVRIAKATVGGRQEGEGAGGAS